MVIENPSQKVRKQTISISSKVVERQNVEKEWDKKNIDGQTDKVSYRVDVKWKEREKKKDVINKKSWKPYIHIWSEVIDLCLL